jgi:hypothetical protein
MMDGDNRPLSEQYRVAAKLWVEADAAANLLEESKGAFLSQLMARRGDMPVSRAELQVKSGAEWEGYIIKMVEARKAASLLKVQLEFIRMRHAEEQSANANRRAEMRL